MTAKNQHDNWEMSDGRCARRLGCFVHKMASLTPFTLLENNGMKMCEACSAVENGLFGRKKQA